MIIYDTMWSTMCSWLSDARDNHTSVNGLLEDAIVIRRFWHDRVDIYPYIEQIQTLFSKISSNGI